MKRKTIMLALALPWLITNLIAQTNQITDNAQIKGSIVNFSQSPVPYATVILMNVDSSFLTGEISDNEGGFTFKNLKLGQYLIKAEHIEYSAQYTSIVDLDKGSNIILPTIILKPGSVNLEEVIVTGKKAMIEVKADKIVFNVASTPSASGTNGLDLMRRAPGVSLDMDNNINLLGKGGVQIYINGRPSRLSGSDLANMLQSVSSDNIETIEIITNPSSKYDAEGTAGIINIVMKNNIPTGINGSLISNISKGRYYRISNGMTLNYGGKKLKTSLNVTRMDNDQPDDLIDIKDQAGFLIDQQTYELKKAKAYNLGFGIEYQLAKNQIFNFNVGAIFNRNDNDLNSNTDIYQPKSTLKEVLVSQTIFDQNTTNYNFGLGYRWDISKTQNLSADISRGTFKNRSMTDQPNTYFGPNRATVLSVQNTAFDTDTDIDILSAKLDYEQSWEKVTLSIGGKYSEVNTTNDFVFFNIQGALPKLDSIRSNLFTYSEKVTAAYSSLDVSLSKTLSFNAGFRVENTNSRGQLISTLSINDKNVPRNYTNFFPNIGFSFNDQKTHALSLSLGRRITRPNYQDLNPFISPLSQLLAWQGNPFLRPNYIMNYQATYSFMQKLTITNSYSVTKDFFASIFEIVGENGNRIIPRNMERATNYGVAISYPQTITKDWDFIAFLNGNRNTYKGNLEGTEIDLTGTFFNVRIQNNIKLPLGITMDMSYFQESGFIWRGSINVKGNKDLSFGLRKEFFDKNLQIRITGADILKTTNQYFYNGFYGGIQLDGVREFDSQRFGIGATWKFGNQSIKTKKKSTSGMDEELNRLQTAE